MTELECYTFVFEMPFFSDLFAYNAKVNPVTVLL